MDRSPAGYADQVDPSPSLWPRLLGDRASDGERAALEEIDLTADVIVAANASDRPLTKEEIDRVLGLG